MSKNKTYQVTLKAIPITGELLLPFPKKMLSELGWKIGDTIKWKNNQDGTYTLTKKEKSSHEI